MLGFEGLLGSVRGKHLPSPRSEEEKGGCGPSFRGWSSKPKQAFPSEACLSGSATAASSGRENTLKA